MSPRAAVAPSSAATSLPIAALADSFEISLGAARKSPRTRQTYLESLRLFDEFLTRNGMPQRVGAIRREHVEAFMNELLARWKPATAANRYGGLQAFFKWCVSEEEIAASPMAKMTPPTVPPTSVPVLSDADLSRLLKACEGTDFTSRRDMAIIRLFISTGMRRAELAELLVEDVDPRGRTVIIRHGKGDKPRVVTFGAKTANIVDRYLRARRAHRRAHEVIRDGRGEAIGHPLWLGPRGQVTGSGIFQVIQSRGEQAGLGKIHPHVFRHTSAHVMLAGGHSEGDVMNLHGWSSRQMVLRYGASAAGERAREAYQRRGLDDRL